MADAPAAQGVVTKGDFSQWPLPHLLTFLLRSASSGRLTIAPTDGEPVEVVLDEGMIVADSADEMAAQKRRLLALFADQSARFEVVPGSSLTPLGAPRVDPRTLLYEGLCAGYSSERLVKALESLAGRKLRVGSPPPAALPDMGFTQEDQPVLSALLTSERSIDEILARGASVDAGRRVVVALHYAEMLEVQGEGASSPAVGAGARKGSKGVPRSTVGGVKPGPGGAGRGAAPALTAAAGKGGAHAPAGASPLQLSEPEPTFFATPPPKPAAAPKAETPPPVTPKPPAPASAAPKSAAGPGTASSAAGGGSSPGGAATTAPGKGAPAVDRGGKESSSQRALISFQKGVVFLRRGQHAQAIAAFQEAADLDPAEARFRAHLAWARFSDPAADRDALVDETVRVLEQAVKDAPRQAPSYLFLGYARKHKGDARKAAEAFEMATRLDPSNHDAERELRLIDMRTREMPAVQDEPSEPGGKGARAGDGKRGRTRPASKDEIKKRVMAGGLGAVMIAVVLSQVLGGEDKPPQPQEPPWAKNRKPAAATSAAPPGPARAGAPAAGAAGVGAPGGPAAARPGVTAAGGGGRPVDILGIPVGVAKGHLTLITTPPGADAWIDGRRQGVTPIELGPGPGSHRVALIKRGFEVVRRIVDATPGYELSELLKAARLPAAGSVGIKVRCKTEGVFPVFVDGADTGLVCPTERIDLQPGRHQVGLYVPADGQMHVQDVDVTDQHGSTRVRFAN